MDEKKPMDLVQEWAEEYAHCRETLADRMQRLNAEIERLKREALPTIRTCVRSCSDARDQLRRVIEAHPELWAGKQRTVVIAGVRVGMTKGKGRITWDCPEQVVKLIRKLFPEQAEAMIRTKEEPIKKAISELSVAELRRIGCVVEDAGDQVVIKATDSEVDKLVGKLLAEAERIEAEAAA